MASLTLAGRIDELTGVPCGVGSVTIAASATVVDDAGRVIFDRMAGVPAAQQWTEAHRGALVAADIGGTTIADVHAYAVSQQPPPPGANPAAVTDAQLTTAVQAVHV